MALETVAVNFATDLKANKLYTKQLKLKKNIILKPKLFLLLKELLPNQIKFFEYFY